MNRRFGVVSLIGLVLVLALSGCNRPGEDAAADVKPAAATGTPGTKNCSKQFVQTKVYDVKLKRFVEGGIDAKTPQKSNDKMLDAVGHSSKYLHLIAADTFNLKNVPAASKLVTSDGKCLSAAGQKVHADLTVVTNASGMKFKDAPKNAFNSGVDSKGNPVVDSSAGLRGNTKAVEYTLPDGSKVYIMVRCGNPVFPSPPKGVPHGPTDNPPPPKKCPPGQVGTPPDCLQPKSGDAKDYPYPAGKPSVTAPGSGDSTPPKVKTSQPGGGGVTDSPTKPPGSETGGTAPGATEPRETTPTQPPEGDGTNDGTVGGF